ncbi:sulfite exporter TauE/SafE family protein [Clostridiaceae bacterium M8S5]|nr:sulfite exporter TauE/SafE family protein [Clostridiaceae bacterium M8S5]
MITYILGALGALTAWFSVVFGKDFMKNKNNLNPKNSWVKVTIIGFITDFFDTLGIGCFAPTTALFKGMKQVDDRVLPGTLNVAHTIPVVLEAFIFIKVIEVDSLTLISMLAAAAFGAYAGAGIVSKMDEKKVQLFMAVALLITVCLMVAGQLGLMPGGGDAIGLSGGKLVIAVVGNFILGALMTAGIGLYAPCMALIYVLGLSSKIAFPIMMGSCAFLMPVASVKFVKEGAYDKRAALGVTIGGIVGVIIAAYIVKELPLNVLKWLVDAVILYTSFTLFKSSLSKKAQQKNASESKAS